MGIGERIRRAIEARNLSLKEAAKTCDISYSSLQNWVGGLREPRPDALVAIGSQLGVSIDWLLTGDGRMFRVEGEVQASSEAYVDSARERAVMALFRLLPDEDQREIEFVIAGKKRLLDIERRLNDLSAVMADGKSSI